MTKTELFNLALNKELKIDDTFFHGEKILKLLKSLKNFELKIDLQRDLITNLWNIVINFTGDSEGCFIFLGQLYSREEIKLNEKREHEQKKQAEKIAKIEARAREKIEKIEQKRLREKNKKLKQVKYIGAKSWVNNTVGVDFENKKVIYFSLSTGLDKIGTGYHELDLNFDEVSQKYYFFNPEANVASSQLNGAIFLEL